MAGAFGGLAARPQVLVRGSKTMDIMNVSRFMCDVTVDTSVIVARMLQLASYSCEGIRKDCRPRMVLEEKHEIISFIHMDVKRSRGSQDRFFFFQKHLGRSCRM